VTGAPNILDTYRISDADRKGITRRVEIMFVPTDEIEPDPGQPRETFDREGLERLGQSLVKFGQLQPVLVRREGSRYVLVSGERRWRAARLAGIRHVECLVCRKDDVRSVQLIENILREDLKPIEQAKAFRAMMDREGWSIREMSRNLHLDHSRVSKALRLLKLPGKVQKDVDAGKIPPTTAYEISKLPGPEQIPAAKAAATGQIKGEDLRTRAASAADVAPRTPAPDARTKPAVTRALTMGRPAVAWTHSTRGVHVQVSGHRDQETLIRALEQALRAAQGGKPTLAGGLGRR
jgi:ParB family transcriptional regulator, chromosome partitioning protein